MLLGTLLTNRSTMNIFFCRNWHLKRCIRILIPILRCIGTETFQYSYGDRMTTMFRHLGLDKFAGSCVLAWGLLKQKMVPFSRTGLLLPALGTHVLCTQAATFRSPAESLWEKNYEGSISAIP